MGQATTDKKEVRHGIPMTPEELADFEKVWTDMEESFANCKPTKTRQTKK